MASTTTNRLLGRVQRVIAKGTAGFGFIVTDDRKKYFFHQSNCVGNILPQPRSLVYFDELKQTAEGKNPRAVHVEIVSVPG